LKRLDLTTVSLLVMLAGTFPLAAQERIAPASSVMPPGYLQAMPATATALIATCPPSDRSGLNPRRSL